jgi:UDP-N-acetylglucosamine:LPS N-acetylglucosamine transferase
MSVVTTHAHNVLVLSAGVGAGHDAMALGLAAEIMTRHSRTSVEIVDGIQLLSPRLHEAWRAGNETGVNKGIYGPLRKVVGSKPGTRVLRLGMRLAFSGRFERLIADRKPDAVVNTFPYFSDPLGSLRRQGKIDVPVYTTLIDAAPHPLWLARGMDAHLVVNPGDMGRIRNTDPLRGVEYLNLRVVQPPVDQRAWQQFDRAAVRFSFGLPQDKNVVLVSGGSLALKLDVPFVQSLLSLETDQFFAVLTGRKTKLAAQINAIDSARVVTIPFTDRMPELLQAVDGIITNSPGMTTLQSFAAKTPVILHNVVPGLGTEGAEALRADGTAVYAQNAHELRAALDEILRDEPQVRARVAKAYSVFTDEPHMSDVVLGGPGR